MTQPTSPPLRHWRIPPLYNTRYVVFHDASLDFEYLEGKEEELCTYVISWMQALLTKTVNEKRKKAEDEAAAQVDRKPVVAQRLKAQAAAVPAPPPPQMPPGVRDLTYRGPVDAKGEPITGIQPAQNSQTQTVPGQFDQTSLPLPITPETAE